MLRNTVAFLFVRILHQTSRTSQKLPSPVFIPSPNFYLKLMKEASPLIKLKGTICSTTHLGSNLRIPILTGHLGMIWEDGHLFGRPCCHFYHIYQNPRSRQSMLSIRAILSSRKTARASGKFVFNVSTNIY